MLSILSVQKERPYQPVDRFCVISADKLVRTDGVTNISRSFHVMTSVENRYADVETLSWRNDFIAAARVDINGNE